MKKPVILLSLVLLLLVSFGCSGPIHTNPQETINTRVGNGFTIGLHVVKRLGASWQVSYDKEMLTLENEKYTDDNPQSPGLGGTQYFQFEAVKANSTFFTIFCILECKVSYILSRAVESIKPSSIT